MFLDVVTSILFYFVLFFFLDYTFTDANQVLKKEQSKKRRILECGIIRIRSRIYEYPAH